MVAMPMKLSSYMTWSASETVASVQLSLNSCYFALQKYSHMILWHQCGHSIAFAGQKILERYINWFMTWNTVIVLHIYCVPITADRKLPVHIIGRSSSEFIYTLAFLEPMPHRQDCYIRLKRLGILYNLSPGSQCMFAFKLSGRVIGTATSVGLFIKQRDERLQCTQNTEARFSTYCECISLICVIILFLQSQSRCCKNVHYSVLWYNAEVLTQTGPWPE